MKCRQHDDGVLGPARHVDQDHGRTSQEHRGLNIAAEYLRTEGDVGYVVIEADAANDFADDVLDEIRAIEGTIRARLLY